MIQRFTEKGIKCDMVNSPLGISISINNDFYIFYEYDKMTKLPFYYVNKHIHDYKNNLRKQKIRKIYDVN